MFQIALKGMSGSSWAWNIALFKMEQIYFGTLPLLSMMEEKLSEPIQTSRLIILLPLLGLQ